MEFVLAFNQKILMRLILSIVLFTGLAATTGFSQGFNPYIYGDVDERQYGFRKILNKITLTVASGAGYTFYHHDLENYTVLRRNDRLYINPNGTQDYYYRWLNNPARSAVTPSGNDQSTVNADTADLGFRGTASGIPALFSLHYQYDRFRIGGGASFEFHRFRNMEPTLYSASLGSYEESFSTIFSKYFFTAGVEFYRFYDYHYYFDLYAGKMNYGKGFNKLLMQGGAFINLGIPIEREFSEYFRFFIRPSYDFKSFKMVLPESSRVIENKNQAFYLNIGFRINYPDLPRCPINSCETQKIHTHRGKTFRGRPFYKKQNPQIGENYKHSPLFKTRDKDAPKSNVPRKDPRK